MATFIKKKEGVALPGNSNGNMGSRVVEFLREGYKIRKESILQKET